MCLQSLSLLPLANSWIDFNFKINCQQYYLCSVSYKLCLGSTSTLKIKWKIFDKLVEVFTAKLNILYYFETIRKSISSYIFFVIKGSVEKLQGSVLKTDTLLYFTVTPWRILNFWRSLMPINAIMKQESIKYLYS